MRVPRGIDQRDAAIVASTEMARERRVISTSVGSPESMREMALTNPSSIIEANSLHTEDRGLKGNRRTQI
jgi:hypothetical protein